jgi:membrane protein required for colicin V production
MTLNWLDFVIIAVIALTFILGIIKGFIKQVIGLAAVIIGIVLAVNKYDEAADFLFSLVNDRMLAHLLGFLIIFFGVLAIGGLASWGFSKLAKGPFKAMNRALGAGLGLVKGILISGVLVFALMIFPVDDNSLQGSEIAPYCLRMIRAAYYLIPRDFKDKFNDVYQDIINGGGERDESRI